jgi:hypothetical protein
MFTSKQDESIVKGTFWTIVIAMSLDYNELRM